MLLLVPPRELKRKKKHQVIIANPSELLGWGAGDTLQTKILGHEKMKDEQTMISRLGLLNIASNSWPEN